jgi:hypothetical protein
MNFVGRLVIVFLLAVVTEGFYTCYAFYVARGDLLRGPLASGGIAVLKAILVIQYVREPVMIAALAIGQVVGTYVTLRLINGGTS